ncbi:MAG: hypothetical protein AAFR59_15450, partial [Bacteroidota bacterium]
MKERLLQRSYVLHTLLILLFSSLLISGCGGKKKLLEAQAAEAAAAKQEAREQLIGNLSSLQSSPVIDKADLNSRKELLSTYERQIQQDFPDDGRLNGLL